jgi:hypothetical protein
VIDESTKQKEKKESKKWSGKMKSEEKFWSRTNQG